jgi:methylmalonyl-CoA mutase
MQTMLEGIDARVKIEGGALTAALFDLIPDAVAGKLKGALDYDPIADVAEGARPYAGADKLLSEIETFVKGAQKKAPNMVPVSIRASHYLEAGGSAVQELAFAIAEGAEYVAKLGPETPIVFNYAIGSSFFVEIAKCRAARLLWANVLAAYGVPEDKAFSKIRAKTALWNKTTFDPYVNMLRVTTEAMAAALGGCDSVTVSPFDATYESSDEFSERIARNVQIILRDEAYLNRVHDVAGGSYYVEVLTDSLAQEAWKLFQKIEAAGGMLKALEQGLIQDEIKSVRDARDTQIAQRRHSILGTNQYPNAKETMSDKVKPAKPTPTTLKVAGEGGVNVTPIVAYRGAERYEKIRLATEAYAAKNGRRPVVFLLTIGSVTMRKARAGFVSNFFGCAGFEIIEGAGYDNLEAGVVDAVKANADMVILCSSDEEYEALGAPFCTLVTKSLPKAVRVVAGYPKDVVDSLKAAGIQDFIHVRTNALDSLTKYQEQFCK